MRSLLIVPAGDAAAYAEALASGADAMVADAATALPGGPALFLRLADAADALPAGGMRPRGVALGRAASGADVQRLGSRLAVEEARLGLPDGALRVIAFATETPEAVFGLASYRGASHRLDALVFTAEPLEAALRAARRDAGPLRLARDLTLLAARAAGALAIDAPYPDADLDGFRAEAQAAAHDGFDGKVARNAAEVAILNAIFPKRG